MFIIQGEKWNKVLLQTKISTILKRHNLGSLIIIIIIIIIILLII